MDTVRLMDTPEDYARLGVQPGEVQVWEDQRRSEPGPGAWEWWYFDAILDDGTQTVIQFFTKSKDTVNDAVDHPTATIKVTLPDGTLYQRADERPLTETDWGEGRAAVRIGPHRFEGDLRTYHIRVDPIDGVGADLHVTSQSKPYRPGTAYFGFGERDEDYFTWLCAVPKAEVSGTLTVDGRSWRSTAAGYHDHQWGTTNYLALWNHWLWARQGFEDYSILVFDLVASQRYGFTRFPICFIQDAEGNLVFENTGELAGCELREIHHDEASGKDYPRSTRSSSTTTAPRWCTTCARTASSTVSMLASTCRRRPGRSSRKPVSTRPMPVTAPRVSCASPTGTSSRSAAASSSTSSCIPVPLPSPSTPDSDRDHQPQEHTQKERRKKAHHESPRARDPGHEPGPSRSGPPPTSGTLTTRPSTAGNSPPRGGPWATCARCSTAGPCSISSPIRWTRPPPATGAMPRNPRAVSAAGTCC